jgi:hypothetical protein
MLNSGRPGRQSQTWGQVVYKKRSTTCGQAFKLAFCEMTDLVFFLDSTCVGEQLTLSMPTYLSLKGKMHTSAHLRLLLLER